MSGEVTIDQLRRAALLMNTKTRIPKLRDILKAHGASRISQVPQSDRFKCLIAILELRTEQEFQRWAMTQ